MPLYEGIADTPVHRLTDDAIEREQARWRDTWPEIELQRRVEALLAVHGWTYLHVRDARRQNLKGFPDILACRGDRLLAAELKTKRGKVTPDQLHWLAVLKAAGVEAFLWRPADWPQIEEVLT